MTTIPPMPDNLSGEPNEPLREFLESLDGLLASLHEDVAAMWATIERTHQRLAECEGNCQRLQGVLDHIVRLRDRAR